ncbi:hypothetical protein [Dyella sp.]|uniref:hypothetical protein n=1 Tax=Dyella sp. TaxID=1869338 RepID=UPI002D76C3AD|nr:hypothetical protein [Dyella sp.]HET7330954.1 hypothetical protein [Dyella sp.]
MTLEIRQMVIKSNIEKGVAGKPAKDEPERDGDCDDCGSKQPSSAERLQARASLLAELERLRER